MPYLILLAGAVALLLWRLFQLRAALLRARAGEARFRQLAEHSVDAGWIIDCASAKLIYISPAAQRLLGHDQAGLETLAAQLALDLPERIQRFAAGDAAAPPSLRSVELTHQDGHAVPVELHSTLVADARGRAVALVGVLRDVSAARAQEQAQKRFASMLSHEFRTPLATIDGAIQRLETTGATADDATRKRYRKIQTAVDRLLALIDEYLTPERMASIGRQRQADGIAPQALLEDAAAQFNSPRHPVTLRASGLPGYLRCDPDGMRLCLQILLDNACAYTPAGSPIELSGQPAPEGGIELCVLDRGPGVPEDELGRLFDKGFRGRNAAAHKGSGLGLYMARAMLDVHGGNLTAQNRAEGGAVFRIWLPIPADTGKNLASHDCNSDNSWTQTEAGIHQS
ncbi:MULTISPECIES: PAS domain-containing sensor histidine kinase [unclassified Janthinobacterium]|uniref:PAS domain-containing sensor histidine kinase n=1 Tax=unclassified Janthinobacterium TaxID=2610881 RepID=UPI00034AB754|nr:MULTISPECIES: PAS domain-containing sensor histidine kinase [unclassified Janthinobacterium]MEC5160155.1 PAS domain S-box-containing protein [Janthinobacterium sp. CG_S6]